MAFLKQFAEVTRTKEALKELGDELRGEIEGILDGYNLDYTFTSDRFEIDTKQIAKLKPSETMKLYREIKRIGCIVMALPVGWVILRRR